MRFQRGCEVNTASHAKQLDEGAMNRKKLVKLIAATIMLAFGVLVSVNWFHIAGGEPGWVAWIVIVLSPLIYPAMVWLLIDRFFPDR